MAAKEHKERKGYRRKFHPLCSVRSFAAKYVFCSRILRGSRLILFLFSAYTLSAQTNAPDVSIFRSVVNDIPNEPLVIVTVEGASNVSCYTIEEDLPGPAYAVVVSNGGMWLPALQAIRWGPFFNTVSNSVSYRLTGPAGSYPVNGGTWMDGEWVFSPGVTLVPVFL